MSIFAGAPPRLTLLHRPSDGVGRSYVAATLDVTSSDGEVHPVTAGSTLHVVTVSVSLRNSSTVTPSILRIRDGDGGDIKLAWEISSGITGGVPPHMEATPTFPLEPLQFSTSVFADISGGLPSFSVSIVGYEEED